MPPPPWLPRFARAGLAALVLLPPPAALPRAETAARSLQLANRHLAPVREVHLVPAGGSEWGPGRLGAQALDMGEEAVVGMKGGCAADLRIVFEGGAAEERRGLDLCATPRVVLRPGWVLAERLDEDGAATVTLPEPAGVLRLRNGGTLPIVEIYADPPGAPRGEDRLGADILPIGAEIEIGPEDAQACAVDLTVVFRDGREVTRRGVDLCGEEEIELR